MTESGLPSAKAQLRARIRHQRAAARKAASAAAWSERAERIAETVCEQPVVRAAAAAGEAVAVYESRRTEPPTGALIERLRALGARVLLPHAAPGHRLGWSADAAPGHRLARSLDAERDQQPAKLPVGAAGLRELGCRVVIVPTVAVGRDRSRLGQGGGYYDRLIAEARATESAEARATDPGCAESPEARAADPGDAAIHFVALVGPEDVVASLPTGELDQPVDAWVCG